MKFRFAELILMY